MYQQTKETVSSGFKECGILEVFANIAVLVLMHASSERC